MAVHLIHGLYSQTVKGPTINTTGEQSFVGTGVGSLSAPANAFSVGDSFHGKIGGKINATGGGGRSEITMRMGKKLSDENHPNKEESIYYWCYKNEIPVFCPAFTDGALGDVMYFDSYREQGFICDINRDLRKLNEKAMRAKKSGQIIIGGGVIKHHINNAHLMRNGADYSVLVNTAQEFDGSDAGARPDEAISWGKIAIGAKSTKVYAEATLVMPIIIGETFVRNFELAKRT